MCGICGFVSRNKITLENLVSMNNTMYHRGPDDSGAEIYNGREGFSFGLAQRRLSIQDLSPHGHQPMYSYDKRISLVFNGEIYNFLELKEELNNYPYVSSCDTEVIIAAYLRWGVHCVERFNGMFAIALYDREKGELYLFRDRVGKKPLFYLWKDNNLVFASELKAIMKCCLFERKINRPVLGRYLFQQCIAEPDSIFENVYKVLPGSYLTWNGRDIEVKQYWDITKRYAELSGKPLGSYAEAKQMLKNLLIDATAKRMISDVPVGTFLSGGYDSSLITSIAQSISSNAVKTFCIGFEEKKYNEALYASRIAEHLQTDHKELVITEKQMLDLVQQIPQYYDEPFADKSQIPSMLVAKLAQNDVTVALTGDGGDELFCGYNKYPQIGRMQKLDMIGTAARHVIDVIGMRDFVRRNKTLYKASVVIDNEDKRFKTQFGGRLYDAFIRDVLSLDDVPYNEVDFKYDESGIDIKNWIVRSMLLDQKYYMTADILHKVDRATMAFSLEARCPILDYRVQELSFRLPVDYKYRNNDKKHILKDITYDYIPRELLERPKKGFGVPLDKWLHGALREQLRQYSQLDYLKRQGIFNSTETNKWINFYIENGDAGAGTGQNYSKVVWSWFVFQLWWEKYCG